MATENHLIQPGLQAARNRAEAWTAHQAERLGVSPEAVSVAIRRGWLANEIDSVVTAAELLLDPPARDRSLLPVTRSTVGRFSMSVASLANSRVRSPLRVRFRRFLRRATRSFFLFFLAATRYYRFAPL